MDRHSTLDRLSFLVFGAWLDADDDNLIPLCPVMSVWGILVRNPHHAEPDYLPAVHFGLN